MMGLGREIGPLIGISASTELRVTDLPVEQITYWHLDAVGVGASARAFPRSAAKSVLGRGAEPALMSDRLRENFACNEP